MNLGSTFGESFLFPLYVFLYIIIEHVFVMVFSIALFFFSSFQFSMLHWLIASLLYSLQSYVLDVHPFNPRIAMSAGYDGRTIVWDVSFWV